MFADIVIVGGGASGIAAAISAKEELPSAKVVIAEKNDRIGKKILATGNGRCNLGNRKIAAERYHGTVRDIVGTIKKAPSPDEFFSSLGILCVSDEQGRMYPRSESAATVLSALRIKLASLGVQEMCGAEVSSYVKNGKVWELTFADGQKLSCRRIIFASGGYAAPQYGTDGSVLRMLRDSGYKTEKICPAVAPLRTSPDAVAIDFDLVYISFMRFAERCGRLEKALDFLNKKCVREQQNTVKLVEASLYPAFVIVLAIFAGIFLFSYSSSLLGLEDFTFERKQDFYSSLIMAFLFLIVFCVIAFLVLRRTLGTNKLYEAFLATGFLVKGGESLANAVMNAVNILGYESKEGQLFAKAGENLSYGMSLKNSFELSDYFGSNSLRCELEEAFFYAENSGGENDVFEKIALWLNSRDEKRRAICFKLIEPFFISGTGIFLLVFLANFVLPFMTGTTLLM